MPVFNAGADTMRTHLGKPLERMGHCGYCTGKQCCLTFGECSICVAFHTASVLFVICLLTRCESATDWNPTRVQTEQGLHFLDPSCSARAINPTKCLESVIYRMAACFLRIPLTASLGERKIYITLISEEQLGEEWNIFLWIYISAVLLFVILQLSMEVMLT